jgi:GT2 family glycosyltransferase/2-polyprenyl-3-methyl-5-hydroxy-6-metoxy-1,4-benzoquinol methylase/glycosyltransferase involved in cell wall biosynthesis
MTAASTSQHTYLRDLDDQRRTSLSVLASMVPAGSRVLDVGTGSGALGKYLSTHKGCIVDGVTHNPEEVAIASPHYRRLELADLELRPLEELFSGETYDVVICADVLEHLRRPEQVLAGARQLLAPGGRILLSVPNVAHFGLIAELLDGDFRYREEGLLDGTHLRFFTRRSLLALLGHHGWQAKRLETIAVELRQSEFQVLPTALPAALLRRLLELPDALSYQFVVEAEPLAAGASADHQRFETVGRSALADHSVALYWRSGGQGYSEAHSLTLWGRVGDDVQDFEFTLPDTTGIDGLRLDPADRPGFVHLQEIRLTSPAGAVLWQWDGQAGSFAETQQAIFGSSAADGGVVLLMSGDDAFLELPIPGDVLAAMPPASRLALRMSWPLSADYQALSENLAMKEASIAAGLGREQSLRDEVTTARGELQAREARLRQLDLEQQRLAEALEASRGQTAWVTEEREQLKRHLQSIEASTIFRITRPLVRAKMALDRHLGRSPSESPPPALAAAATEPTETPVTPPDAPVDVIVPVYRGLDDTRRCLESVLASPVTTTYRLVVIDDAGPEPEVRDYLRGLAAAEPRVLLLENERNLGFVATVNRGMALNPGHDVLLLNSDTEVANDWLDRLRSAAYADQRVGSVTPLSNNATICSYPRFCKDNELPSGFDTASLDRLCARTNPTLHVDIPTGVGFCMYIRRDCLDQVGLFDVERFGKGYGEENDFCMRALEAGWRHLLALDTFVLHTGGVSFGDAKKPREIEAFEKLRQLHPRYEPLVRAHVAADPARPARLAIDVARLRATARPAILYVTHARGGGTERHVQELADAVTGVANALVLRPAAGGAMAVEWLAKGEEDFRFCFQLPADLDALCQLLAGLGVGHIHFHHLLGLAPQVWGLPQRLGVSFDFTAHDHYALCPQISLTGRDNRYCGELGPEQCTTCLRQSPAPGGVGIIEWRLNYRQLLRRARHVFAPSEDTARRLRREFPEIEVRAVEHPDLEGVALPPPEPRPLAPDAPLRIAVIGAMSVIKGADILEQTALEAARRGAPIEFHLLGYAYRSLATQPKAHLTIHGEYADADLDALLTWLNPDLVWFPALWPETYSYTLSACLQAGLPVVAPDLGAFPERLAGRAWSWVAPWDQPADQWLAYFADLRDRHFATGQPPAPLPLEAAAGPVFCYRADYLVGITRPTALPEVPPALLAAHAFDQRQGVDAAQREMKRMTLGLLVRLRNARLLSGLARRIPLRWQTRVKTWLAG